jgi:hypothetical protein
MRKLFITGCDASSEWMLPWFVENFRKHNDHDLMIFDFGMEGSWYPEIRKSIRTPLNGWFNKPIAMEKATAYADQVCWLDTDCEVLGDLSGVFDYVKPEKLSMVIDYPWTTRKRETWHNSGVVAFEGKPGILKWWRVECLMTNLRGDQEVLHEMVNPGLKRLQYIEDLPNRYNVLRIQHIDKTVPKDPLVYHWTGPKGKDHIRKLMNG